MHCASCIQLIENALTCEPDVIQSRVNMSTNRLSISWKGTAKRADELAKIVLDLGYKLTPFDSANEPPAMSEEKFLLRCMAISGFAMGNIMLISVGLWASSTEAMGVSTRDLFHWLSALIALPTIIYAGQPFFRSALTVLRQGKTNMDVPISLALVLASAMSLHETMFHGQHVYFDSAVMLCFFLLIGRYLDARAKGKARETAKELLGMLGGTATILTKCGHQKTIPIRELKPDMTALVAMGEYIPGDGVITHGKSDIDMSMISGETLPIHTKVGDTVFAGTTNLSAPLTITISKASENSLLSDIVKLMEKAEQGQAHYVRLADKAARLYTPVVHTLGALTFFYWWLVAGMAWQPALLIAITVLIITCPCALGLAVPVVQVLASSKLMKQGILLKSGDALERLASIKTAAFDKTGTLTLGRPSFLHSTDVEQSDLKIATSLASHSKHPLSKALCDAYSETLCAVEKVNELPGKGLEGVVDGKQVRLGSRSWCGDADAEASNILELWLSVEGKAPICFQFVDSAKEDAARTVQQLTNEGLDLTILSGDRKEVVASLAKALNINKYQGELSPLDKCEHIEQLKKQGDVLMVGDGLNDAPSLAAASVSMSPASAIDISQNTADIIFQGDKLESVFTAWETAKASTKLVKQNFALAVAYNIIAIPLAVMGHVTPLIAALAMSGSSLLVIGNSFRLNLSRGR